MTYPTLQERQRITKELGRDPRVVRAAAKLRKSLRDAETAFKVFATVDETWIPDMGFDARDERRGASDELFRTLDRLFKDRYVTRFMDLRQ